MCLLNTSKTLFKHIKVKLDVFSHFKQSFADMRVQRTIMWVCMSSPFLAKTHFNWPSTSATYIFTTTNISNPCAFFVVVTPLVELSSWVDTHSWHTRNFLASTHYAFCLVRDERVQALASHEHPYTFITSLNSSSTEMMSEKLQTTLPVSWRLDESVCLCV